VGREIVDHDEILGSERRGKTPFDTKQLIYLTFLAIARLTVPANSSAASSTFARRRAF
jgi:hypothetical protein